MDTRVTAPGWSDRFKLLQCIGKGSFGNVYAARDEVSGHEIALKFLHDEHPTAPYYFKREFRTLAKLGHPNLVSLFELFQDQNQWFFTMELVPGRTIVSALREPSRAPEAVIRDAFAQLARALCFLHDRGVLHRDVKPANVLVTPAGRVVVLDFGLAFEDGGLPETSSSALAGTPRYMAPERFLGVHASEASDWYAVGLVLYEVLIGRPPPVALSVATNPRDVDEHLRALATDDVPPWLATLCRDLLAPRPEDRPTGASILARLQGAGAPSRNDEPPREQASPARSTRLLGRDQELDALRSALEDTSHGRPVTVHVLGESGVGKTALCEEFLQEAQHRSDAVVLRGRCYSQESFSYKALDGALESLARHLAGLPPEQAREVLPTQVHDLSQMFPVLRRIPAVASARRRVARTKDAAEIKRNAFQALRDLLARIAAQQPLVILLDDVQWGDAESASALQGLLEHASAPALLLLLAYRSDEQTESPFLATASAQPDAFEWEIDARRVHLRPLAPPLCHELVERFNPEGKLPPAAVESIVTEAGGNPLLLEQLSSLSQLEDAPTPSLGGSSTSPIAPRSSLFGRLLEIRLAGLSSSWRRLVEVIAIAGQPIDVRVAGQAAGIEAVNLGILNNLRASHLIRMRRSDGASRLAPYHDRIREAIVAGLDPSNRQDLHLAVAEALAESHDCPPRLVSSHFRAAERLERAADFAHRAAEEADSALAFEDAAELYAKVLEWRPGAQADPSLMRRYADALANAGRCAAAAPLYLDISRRAQGVEALDLERRAFEQFYIGGMRDEALEILHGLFTNAGLGRLRESRLGLAYDFLRLRLRGFEFEEHDSGAIGPLDKLHVDICYTASEAMLRRDQLLQMRCAVRGLLLALAIGDPRRIAMGLAPIAAVLAMFHPKTGRKAYAVARTLEERLDDTRVSGNFRLWSGMLDLIEGRWVSALDAADEAIACFRESTGVGGVTQQALVLSLICATQLGRFDELSRRAEEVRAHGRSTGNRYLEAYGDMTLAIPRLMADQVERARLRLAGAEQSFPRGDTSRVNAWVWRCACDLYEGKAQDAARRLAEAEPDIAASSTSRHPLYFSSISILRAKVGLANSTSRSARGRDGAAIERAIAGLRAIDLPNTSGQAALLEAGLGALRGDRALARRRCEAAVDGFEGAGLASDAAVARRRLGELTPGSAGERLVAEADAWLELQGVVDPERWVRCRAPGFTPIES